MDTVTIPDPRPLSAGVEPGEEIVGVPDIAFITGVGAQAVNTWRFRELANRPKLPEPDDHIGSKPVWRFTERVVPWLEATGRPTDLESWREKKKAGEFRRPAHLMPPKSKTA